MDLQGENEMFRVLVAVDGSKSSDRAVAQLLKKLPWYREKVDIHLLNVQSAVPGNASHVVSTERLEAYHREQGEAALASARAILDGASVDYATHIGVGDPASVIARHAGEKAVDQIVMGARGLGGVAGMLMGSVTTKVLGLTEIPVLLIR